MLKNLNVISSTIAPKDKTALWLKKENNSGSLYYNDGIEWKPLSSAGGTGATDYPSLTGKPSINGVVLEGDKTPEELGMYSKGETDEKFETKTQAAAALAQYAKTAEVTEMINKAVVAAINTEI